MMEVYRALTCPAQAGTGLPEVCQPGDRTRPCSRCGGVQWGAPVVQEVDGRRSASLVFLHSAVTTISFAVCHCEATEACPGIREPDKQEVGLLRQTARLAFGYDFLYSLDMAMGVTFPSFWGHFKGALNRDVNLAARHGVAVADRRSVTSSGTALPLSMPISIWCSCSTSTTPAASVAHVLHPIS